MKKDFLIIGIILLLCGLLLLPSIVNADITTGLGVEGADITLINTDNHMYRKIYFHSNVEISGLMNWSGDIHMLLGLLVIKVFSLEPCEITLTQTFPPYRTIIYENIEFDNMIMINNIRAK